ncbi:MAG: hypothetical protein LKG21_08555 [Ruminococcus sp.]|nr:hypothetical protein [Ruminococcus sp.]
MPLNKLGGDYMKKINVLSLTIASITAILCACGNTNTATDSENKKDSSQTTVSESTSTKGKTVTITTNSETVKKTETSTTISETVKKTETSTTVSETVNKAETSAEVNETEDNTETNAEPVINHQLNFDLLSNIGLTYDEIISTYGNLKDVSKLPNGDFCYSFTQGCMGYLWHFDEVNKVGNMLLPNAGVKCGGILIFEAKDFFLELNSSVNPSELEKMYDITYISSGYNAHDDCNYSDFKLDDKYIYVITKESEIISPDSQLQISLLMK